MRIEFHTHEPAEVLHALAAFISQLAGLPAPVVFTETSGTLEQRPDEDAAAQAPAADGSRGVDQHGVPFYGAMCANAKEPFYTSGPRAGQWKKARGVEDAAYDQWYASVKPAAPQPQPTGLPPAAPVNTAAAFGAAPPPAAAAPAPKNVGELMTWVAEMQAAGRLSQQQVTDGYAAVGVTIPDLFGGDQNAIAERVGRVFAHLSQVAGV